MVTQTRTKPKLDTATLTGVEILAVGKWNGDDYALTDLHDIATAYTALKGRFDPVLKLGHDGTQKLAQADGYPALGWATSVRVEGNKLLADFDRVPRKVADLIEAGGYDKVSSEVYFDRTIDGIKYPRVLKAVALLGADAPAVKDIKSISDVADLYEDILPAAEAHYADYAEPKGTDENPDPDNDGDDDRPGSTNNPDAEDDAKLEDDAISDFTALCMKLEDRIKGVSGAKNLRAFLGVTRKQLAEMKIKPRTAGLKENDMDIKKLAEMLGLPETATEADVETAIKAAKSKPAEYSDEVRTLREKVATLESQRVSELAEREVDKAIRVDGKFAPTVRDQLVKMAVDDLDGFRKYAEATPKLGILSTIGTEHGADADKGEPSDVARSLAEQMGVSPESLKRAASGVPSSTLAREARELANRK